MLLTFIFSRKFSSFSYILGGDFRENENMDFPENVENLKFSFKPPIHVLASYFYHPLSSALSTVYTVCALIL